MLETLGTPAFWRGLAERALKTAVQTLAASLVVGVGVLELDWYAALSLTAAATLASILTSIGNPEFVAGSPVDAPTPPAQFVQAQTRAERRGRH